MSATTNETTAQGYVTVMDPYGLHVRPAVQLVKTASEFEADVTLHYGDVSVNAKSFLSILTLCIQHGEKLAVVACGIDAGRAVKAIEAVLSRFSPNSESLMA